MCLGVSCACVDVLTESARQSIQRVVFLDVVFVWNRSGDRFPVAAIRVV